MVRRGIVGHAAPMAAEAFHELLQRDRTAALGKLDEFKAGAAPYGASRFEEIVEFVRTVVADNPEDGLVLLSVDGDLDEDLIRGTLSGWSSGELGDDLAYAWPIGSHCSTWAAGARDRRP